MFQIQQARRGSTLLLILSVLNDGPLHGYAIMRELEARSEGYFSMTAALLYPTLHQMEKDNLVEGTWEGDQGKRRKKIYSITPRGKEQLAKASSEWKHFFDRLFGVINPPDQIRRTQ